ncbi:MFS transporter [Geobacter sp. OR-1]|uniref:MFS transporter n=1 Tax=Geobacter sp. OR-1 TaxID=1266765 RepID=UPI0005A9F852|nr:MFS transporter [Geobacter sp. OR-1]
MTWTNRPGYCWIVLFAGTLAVFAALGLARFGYTVVLPAMQTGLGLDNTQAGALATANLAGYLAMAAIGGALASHLGPRSVIAAGLAVSGLAMILTGMADSFLAAAAWRCLTGVGSGAANIAVMGMWAAWFPANRRGFAAGIAVSGSSLALIAVGPLAPELMQLYGQSGWRFCWYLFGAASLAIALLCLLLVRNRGAASLSLATPYAGATQTPPAVNRSWSSVYRSWPVWHLGFVYVAFGFSYIIFMTFFVKHLISAGGYSRAEAGSLFMAMGWASLMGGFLWGAISDRIGRKHTLVAVYLIHSATFALFGLTTSRWGFIVAAVCYGLSAFSIPAIMAAACGDILGHRMAPAALGFVTLFFGIGQAVGPSVAGMMADSSGSFATALLLASLVALLGAIGSATLQSRPNQDESGL